jgi:hypothetical protein
MNLGQIVGTSPVGAHWHRDVRLPLRRLPPRRLSEFDFSHPLSKQLLATRSMVTCPIGL